MPAQPFVVVAVGDVEREGGDRAEPAQADAGAVAHGHVFEVAGNAADIVKQREGETFFNRKLIFGAGHRHCAVGQDGGAVA